MPPSTAHAMCRTPSATPPIRASASASLACLSDGRAFTIVKRYWTPAGLEDDLAALGWDARCATTDWAFLHGTATRRT